jgi:hypothetical protein
VPSIGNPRDCSAIVASIFREHQRLIETFIWTKDDHEMMTQGTGKERVFLPLAILLTSTLGLSSAAEAQNCQALLENNTYVCTVIPENESSNSFLDNFTFISPGTESSKMDLEVESIFNFSGIVFGCSCNPRYPSKQDYLQIEFNKGRNFKCVGNDEDPVNGSSLFFEGTATTNGSRIIDGMAFDSFGGSFVYTCNKTTLINANSQRLMRSESVASPDVLNWSPKH